MTKYILNSGGLANNPEGARKYIAEIVKGFGDHPRILLCFFANPRTEWEDLFVKYEEMFTTWLPEGVVATFELAFPDTFVEHIQQSNALYIHGGDDHLLQYWLKQFDMPRIWEGKTVATNSASSDALAKHFWTCDWRMCMNGLGVLPIKFIAHYGSEYGARDPRGPVDWEKGYAELEKFGDTSLPIYTLREGEYVVIER